MSNLSELLPAGAGAKSADFVASGTLASGQTVVLKADGTVEAVVATGGNLVFGTPVAGNSSVVNVVSSTYDPVSGKVIIIYSDAGNSSYGTYVVGTVSGSTITYGTPTVYITQSTSGYADITYDTNANKVVIAWRGTSNYGRAIVGTVSGTSISFGSETIFASAITIDIFCGFDSSSNKVLIVYNDGGNSYTATAIVGTVSGTSISFGSEAVMYSGRWYTPQLAFDTVANKFGVGYRDAANSFYVTAVVLTISGTSVSAGSPTVLASVNGSFTPVAYNTQSGKFALFHRNGSDGVGVVFSISGTSIVAGNSTTFDAGLTPYRMSCAYVGSTQGVLLAYVQNSSLTSKYIFAAISGTTITFSSSTTFDTTVIVQEPFGVAYDANTGTAVISYKGASSYLYSSAASSGNSANFIGITDQAIADTATGAVVVQGGVITNTGLIPYTGSSGSPVTYMSTGGFYSSLSYDTNANKIVVANRKDSPSNYGVAFVGTVSGTSISFGAEATFNAANSDNISSVFDSNSNKVVIAYSDVGNSSHGTVVVGTVSGTTISFGTAVVFEAAAVQGISISFDSTNNKVVIFYEDDANSDYGTAIVGTVSGTSISFGTPVVFDSVNMQITGGEAAVYDSANNRAVIFYRNSNYEGYAAVGTVSGTSISFGTPVKFSSGAAELNYISATFDSAANKIVTSYRVNNDSGYGKAIVGTVSGTSISFGLESTFESASTNFTSSTFNSTLNQVVISYSDAGNSNYGTFVIATVSGTNISFSTPAVFSSTTAAQYIATTFDSDTNNLVSSYADSAASYHPKSVVTSFLNDLTIGTDYYVQSDGSLSTTTSTVPAGRALSSTSILLEG